MNFLIINKIKITTTFLSLFFVTVCSGQDINKVWELLLNNKRQEALLLVNKKQFVKDIETHFTKKLVEVENGYLTPNIEFVEKSLKYPQFEYYLFSYWNESFFFSNYHIDGYRKYHTKITDKIAHYPFKNNTIINAVMYMRTINERHNLNWNKYRELGEKVKHISNWEYCGVFENLNNSGLTIPYEPETTAYTESFFDGRNIGELNWYKAPETNGDPYQFFTNHTEHGAGVNYAQTFIYSPDQKRVLLRVGAGGTIRIWLNDVLIFENDKESITEMDAYNIAVTLQKGNNRLLVKLANEDSYPYFIVRIDDEIGTKTEEKLQGSTTDKKYKKATKQTVNPIVVENELIKFLKEKYKNNPVSFFDTYSLFNALMRYNRYEEAELLLKKWLKKYPKSSFLKILQINIYNAYGNDTEALKLQKNIQTQDPNYYFSLLLTFKDTDALLKKDMNSFKKELSNIKNNVHLDFIKNGLDFFLYARQNNLDSLEIILDKIIKDHNLNEKILLSFSSFYDRLLNKEDKTIATLENLNRNNLYYSLRLRLSQYYKKQGKTKKSLQVLKEILEYIDEDNNALHDYIVLLHENNLYKESIPYIIQAIENYPYTSVFKKLLAETYFYLGQKSKALQYYEEALNSDLTNHNLRKIISDLTNEENPIEKLRTKDFYEFISKSRNTIKQNNYGYNTLLDELNILAYESGGGKYTGTFIYEVTSQKGIENLKEYNLELYGDYVIYKSEIVKKDGTVVPAEKNRSNLVFNGLEEGDVILIDFENTITSSGRFYKDFIDSNSFQNYTPVYLKRYRIITKIKNLPYKTINGNVKFKKYKLNNYNVYQWEEKNIKEIPVYEAYMPEFVDVVKSVNISTITSWNEISKWYSDLVRSQIIIDDIVKNTFNFIFPAGFENLSEEERARRIYNYVTGDFTYSYVSFKQSGFVPQKPSKTITTKLGDCKDFSTLYVALSKLAKLKASLILVSTSDNGNNALVLPSTDFNHCIVKVMINGKEHFFELTDKYLPFKSIPISLHDALALEIPYDSNNNKTYDLFKLTQLERERDVLISQADVTVTNDSINVKLKTEISGHLRSNYIETFNEKNKELLKDKIHNKISNRLGRDITLHSIDNKNINKESIFISFTTSLSINEKINSIGSFKTFKIPFFLNPYNQSIIKLESRKHPIQYKFYENADEYFETINIQLQENQKFIEIPKNNYFKFKNHSYSITYNLIKPNLLKIEMKSTPGKGIILPQEYPEFKKFVQKVLEVKKQFLAFK